MKTGVSMGTIIVTKKAKDKKIIQYKKSSARKKRATICIEYEHNNEGYCNRYSAWCGRVNYICLGIKDPYEYKIPKVKPKVKAKAKAKKRKKLNRTSPKGQVVKGITL